MLFKRTLQRYGQTDGPVTPYHRAAQLWDERLGSARVQAKNWRLMAFGSLTLSIGLAGGLIWQSAQSRITPYVVEVDKLGEVRAVGPAIQPYQPADAQMAWYLARFVTDVRSLSIDPVLLRQNWFEAYDYARANDPFKGVGEKTISVQVTSVVRASADSFQVKWTEQTYQQGNLAKTEHWTAILSVVLQQPRTADVLHKNPLGVYVNGLSWSRELNPGETP